MEGRSIGKLPFVNPYWLGSMRLCIPCTLLSDFQEHFGHCKGGSDAAACWSAAPTTQAAAHFKYHVKTFAHGTQAHTHVLLTYCWFPSLLSSAFFSLFFSFLRFHGQWESCVEQQSSRAAASCLSSSLSSGCVQLAQEHLTLGSRKKPDTVLWVQSWTRTLLFSYGNQCVSP